MINLYRGSDIKWIISYLNWGSWQYINLTNELEFAKDYWEIVCEFEVSWDVNIIEEVIDDRKDDVKEYDDIMNIQEIGWYKWNIWEWVYHYRINKKHLKLVNIIYTWDLKQNIANLCLLNRKYQWISQEELATQLGTKKANISKYEHWKNIPDISRITKFIFIKDYSQQMIINNMGVTFRKT